METVHALYDAEESVRRDFPWEKLVALVTAVVGRMVAAMNTLGLFHHKEVGPSR